MACSRVKVAYASIEIVEGDKYGELNGNFNQLLAILAVSCVQHILMKLDLSLQHK
jgi:hypothetical protein